MIGRVYKYKNINKIMKRKNFLLSFLLLAGFVFYLTLVSAVPVLTAPVTDLTLTGATVALNVTNGTLTEMLNCTWYASSSLTANDTAVEVGTQTNESASAVLINTTFDSTILEDADNYVFYAICFNETTNETTVDSTGVTIDNTIPQAPTLSPADLTLRTTSGTQTFTGTVTDENTTSCTYTIYRGGSSADGDSGSGSYSGTSCTFTKTFSTSADNGVWWWTQTASDETNTTSSSTYKYTVSIPGGGGGLPDSLTIGVGEEDGKVWTWVIAIIVILAIIGFIYYISKK